MPHRSIVSTFAVLALAGTHSSVPSGERRAGQRAAGLRHQQRDGVRWRSSRPTTDRRALRRRRYPTTFNASGSADADGRVVRYRWDFADGTVLRDGGAAPRTSTAPRATTQCG
ncbi:PKD domain-containing protein [Micromonospora sp. CPCC 206061]|uniref:PKD domain-containing protein n=1 Tax=Micromonospora sp. CPCC 206061 TaxID=3122410 RepID=UPI002FF0B941